jgi:hypothetical protein
VIHRFARIHLTERRRDKVARMVSPESRSSVRPSSKATSAAISNEGPKAPGAPELPRRAVEHLPQGFGALFLVEGRVHALGARGASGESVEAALVEGADSAFLTVCEAHPRLRAIFGGDSPGALARRIWDRRITKASLDRSPAWSRSRSFFDSSRTKIGGFMQPTIAHHTQPSLMMH